MFKTTFIRILLTGFLLIKLCGAGVIGYWSLDEGSGSIAADSSAFGNTAALMGNTVWDTGISGNCAGFSDTTCVIDCGSDSSLRFTRDFSVSFWLNPDPASPKWGRVLMNKTDENNAFDITFDPNNRQMEVVSVKNGVRHDLKAGPGEVDFNSWNHVAVVFSGTDNVEVYINGSLHENRYNTGINLGTGGFQIGSVTGDSTRFFAGLLDEVLLFSHALSAEQADSLFYVYHVPDTTAGTGGMDLAGYWSCNEGTGDTAFDMTGMAQPAILSTAGWGTGIAGSALLFDDLADQVGCGNGSGPAFTDEYTVSLWFKPAAACPQWARLAMFYGDADNAYDITYDPNGQRIEVLSTKNGVQEDLKATAGVVLDTAWNHVAVTFSGLNTVRVFVNGDSCENSYNGGSHFGSGGLQFGGVANDNDRAYLGLIDEVRIYNYSLDAGQIIDLYQHPGNADPVITSEPDLLADESFSYVYQVTAADADHDTLTYVLDAGPAGMNIDPVTGLVTWNPAGFQSGSVDISISVDDGNGGIDRQDFCLSVSALADSLDTTVTDTGDYHFGGTGVKITVAQLGGSGKIKVIVHADSFPPDLPGVDKPIKRTYKIEKDSTLTSLQAIMYLQYLQEEFDSSSITNEASLYAARYHDGAWTPYPSVVDTLSNTIICTTDGFSVWGIGGDGGALPVTFGSFTGTYRDGRVLLAWTTLSEQDNIGYHVLKSDYPEGGFNQVNETLIPGLGTTGMPRAYTFTDPDAAAGTWYYVIEQVDADGGSSRSDVITVELSATGISQEITVESMPGEGEVVFAVPSERMLQITVLTPAGREVAVAGPKMYTAGRHGIHIPAGLTAGMYLVEIREGSTRYVSRILMR